MLRFRRDALPPFGVPRRHDAKKEKKKKHPVAETGPRLFSLSRGIAADDSVALLNALLEKSVLFFSSRAVAIARPVLVKPRRRRVRINSFARFLFETSSRTADYAKSSYSLAIKSRAPRDALAAVISRRSNIALVAPLESSAGIGEALSS